MKIIKASILFVIILAFILSGCKITEAKEPVSEKPVRDVGTEYTFESRTPAFDNGNRLDGYWKEGYWVPGLPTIESHLLISPKLTTGVATYYDPNVMLATAQVRGWSNTQLAKYEGQVSLMTAGDIGSKVWLKFPDRPWWGPFLVVDCAQRDDIYTIVVDWGEVVEVDFPTAVKLGMAQYGCYDEWGIRKTECHTDLIYRLDNVQVSKVNPRELMGSDEVPVKLSEWFLDNVKYQKEDDPRDLDWLEVDDDWETGFKWVLNDTIIQTDPNNP